MIILAKVNLGGLNIMNKPSPSDKRNTTDAKKVEDNKQEAKTEVKNQQVASKPNIDEQKSNDKVAADKNIKLDNKKADKQKAVNKDAPPKQGKAGSMLFTLLACGVTAAGVIGTQSFWLQQQNSTTVDDLQSNLVAVQEKMAAFEAKQLEINEKVQTIEQQITNFEANKEAESSAYMELKEQLENLEKQSSSYEKQMEELLYGTNNKADESTKEQDVDKVEQTPEQATTIEAEASDDATAEEKASVTPETSLGAASTVSQKFSVYDELGKLGDRVIKLENMLGAISENDDVSALKANIAELKANLTELNEGFAALTANEESLKADLEEVKSDFENYKVEQEKVSNKLSQASFMTSSLEALRLQLFMTDNNFNDYKQLAIEAFSDEEEQAAQLKALEEPKESYYEIVSEFLSFENDIAYLLSKSSSNGLKKAFNEVMTIQKVGDETDVFFEQLSQSLQNRDINGFYEVLQTKSDNNQLQDFLADWLVKLDEYRKVETTIQSLKQQVLKTE